MAFFKRSALKEKGLTDEQIEYVLTESGRLIADYIPKSEMNEKLEEAKNAVPDFHETDEWKAMVNANSALTAENAKIKALSSDDFAGVKNQYRDILWEKIDHGEKAKPISEQISGFRETRAPGEHGGALARRPGSQTPLRLPVPHPAPLPGRRRRRQGRPRHRQPGQASSSRKLCQTRVAPGDLLPAGRLLGPVLHGGQRGRRVRQELESGGSGPGGAGAADPGPAAANSALELVGFLPFVL